MRPEPRLAALDHLRGFVITLVVLHHAILAYCRFGHVDRHPYLLSTAPVVDGQRWAGFDLLVTLNDGFFMPLMFLLSGLFVSRGVQRRGARAYLGRRTLRLGLPFVVAVLTVVPLAYYPSWLRPGGAPGFPRFWVDMVTVGPWPSGPPWFLAVLLLFDTVAALALAILPRRSEEASEQATPMRGRAFGLLLPGLMLAYLPPLFAFGPSRWISFGPLAVQASRIGLYGVSFAAGVLLGAAGLGGNEAPLRPMLVRRWYAWVTLATAAGAVLVGTQVARLRHSDALLGWAWLGTYGLALAAFCAAACVAALAVCLRFAGRRSRVWDSLAASSFGIYLLHYPVVTWVQFGLLQTALALSWALAALPWRAVCILSRASLSARSRGP